MEFYSAKLLWICGIALRAENILTLSPHLFSISIHLPARVVRFNGEWRHQSTMEGGEVWPLESTRRSSSTNFLKCRSALRGGVTAASRVDVPYHSEVRCHAIPWRRASTCHTIREVTRCVESEDTPHHTYARWTALKFHLEASSLIS